LSYERLATFKLKNLDDDFIYTIYFDNMLKKWNIILDDSTEADSVDIHDVTTAMAEANMSLSLAQTVISRMVSSWNEITTTR
jgi:flagellar hook-basal body complex protein FliE